MATHEQARQQYREVIKKAEQVRNEAISGLRALEAQEPLSDDALRAEWNADAALRREFGSFTRFRAYARNKSRITLAHRDR